MSGLKLEEMDRDVILEAKQLGFSDKQIGSALKVGRTGVELYLVAAHHIVY
jgi:hypothetical protein